MIDPRFYELLGPLPAKALAEGFALLGDGDRRIKAPAAFERAGPEEVTFLDGKGEAPVASNAGLVFTDERNARRLPSGATYVVCPRPRAAFAATALRLVRERSFAAGAAMIDPTATIEDGARILPGAVIGAGAQIGAGAVIGPAAVIGPGVAIGRRTTIGAGCVIEKALIGDGVVLSGNCVIGASGFGVTIGPDGPVDTPHFGRAILMDRVSLGACVTVDRGLFDDTVLGEGVKIDNHGHIAHNCTIGRGVLMAAFAGISGSVTIGDGAVLGGRVGVGDHRTVGAQAQIGAGAGVLRDVPRAETWTGYPAKPMRQFLRELAWLAKAAGRRDER